MHSGSGAYHQPKQLACGTPPLLTELNLKHTYSALLPLPPATRHPPTCWGSVMRYSPMAVMTCAHKASEHIELMHISHCGPDLDPDQHSGDTLAAVLTMQTHELEHTSPGTAACRACPERSVLGQSRLVGWGPQAQWCGACLGGVGVEGGQRRPQAQASRGSVPLAPLLHAGQQPQLAPHLQGRTRVRTDRCYAVLLFRSCCCSGRHPTQSPSALRNQAAHACPATSPHLTHPSTQSLQRSPPAPSHTLASNASRTRPCDSSVLPSTSVLPPGSSTKRGSRREATSWRRP